MIIESIITTLNADGTAHIAPMGVTWRDGTPILAPFRPSITLENLTRADRAVINHTDDVRIFAGCLTGRPNWPVRPAETIACAVLEAALSHEELVVDRVEQDELRPRFFGRIVHRVTHAPFAGFNRAQAAVIEAAILVSRLHMLPPEKIEREIAYLNIAIEKTAGPRELQAWNWLIERIAAFRSGSEGKAAS
ncbi:MAG TPA: DUF447 domain-containing protein [Alphaproteobacteria bacterium]|nr:DUF447 domain-containing protein [Alphaproteobacteria bacterium]